MKNINLKTLLIAASALVAFGHIGTAAAITPLIFSNLSLGGQATLNGLPDDSSATDYYMVTCSNDPNTGTPTYQFGIALRTDSGAPLVSVQVVNLNLGNYNYTAMNATDPVNGDANFSPVILLPGGNGNYAVYVDKTGPGKVTYTLETGCVTNGLTQMTGFGGKVIQDQ